METWRMKIEASSSYPVARIIVILLLVTVSVEPRDVCVLNVVDGTWINNDTHKYNCTRGIVTIEPGDALPKIRDDFKIGSLHKDHLLDRLKTLEGNFIHGLNSAMDLIWPTMEKLIEQANVSYPCQSILDKFKYDIRMAQTWAVMMLDASGKFPTGFLDGTVADLGSYDLCHYIDIPSGPNHDLPFKGQYCSLEFVPPVPNKPRFYNLFETLPEVKDIPDGIDVNVVHFVARYIHLFFAVPLRLGVCVPSTCTPEDIGNIVKEVSNHWQVSGKLMGCELRENEPIEYSQKVGWFLLTAAFSVVALASILDYHRQGSDDEFPLGMRALLCFSLYTNIPKLLDTTPVKGSLGSLHGIKVLTILWVILAHSYLFVKKFMFRNLVSMMEGSKGLAFQGISNGTVSVDTFFFISGLLTTFIMIKYMKNTNQKFNIPLYIFHRFWRLTPTYAMVIVFTMVLPGLSKGPLWKETVGALAERCKTEWWTNLLYISNIVTPANQCLQHSWFLPADVQFHILGLVIIIPMANGHIKRALKNTLWFSGICALVTASITWYKDYPPTELYVHPDEDDRMEMKSLIYYQFYPHTGAYCIGLWLGYALATGNTFKLSKNQVITGWFMAIFSSLAVLFGVYPWNNGSLPSPLLSALYASTHRTVWTLALAWVVYACVHGHGGAVNTFLCWRGFIPLSRLTFLAYLLHPHVQWVYAGQARERTYYSHYGMVYSFVGHLVITYLASLIFSAAFESPFLALEKILLRKQVKTADKKLKEKVNLD